MKKILLGLVFLLTIATASASEVWINEVYYDPLGSESDGEFAELYNPQDYDVDISGWTLEDSSGIEATIPSNTTMSAGGYYLIADGGFAEGKDDPTWPDADLEDEMTLTNSDYGFSLKNGEIIIDSVGWGNADIYEGSPHEGVSSGYSLTRLEDTEDNSVDFIEGVPSPMNSQGEQEEAEEGFVDVLVIVGNAAPVIDSIDILPDDSEDEGFQVMPNLLDVKPVTVIAEVSDLNISNVLLGFNGESFSMDFQEEVDEDTNKYNYTFDMNYYDLAGNYEVEVSAFDLEGLNSSSTETFEYLGVLSSTLSANLIDFGVVGPGTLSDDEIIGILNRGNVVIDTLVGGNDLVSDSGSIEVSNMEVSYGNGFSVLGYLEILLDLNLDPGEAALQDLAFRLNVPVDAMQDTYNGNVTITGVESA